MIFKAYYQSAIYSNSFTKQHLQFEKKIYETLTTQCQKSIHNYNECAKTYKSKIQSIAKFTHLLLQHRLQNLEQQCKDQCSNYNNSTEIFNCIQNIERKYLKLYHQDIQYIQLIRQSIIQSLK